MAQLILDLDETVIYALESVNKIDAYHKLSENICKTTALDGNSYNFKIINPEQISLLIQHAYEKHDGVIILTSGYWSDSIRTLLAQQLVLSEEVNNQFKNCRFHSSYTDMSLLKLDMVEVSRMRKYERFSEIVRVSPELQNKHFVFLDDSYTHVRSFKNCNYVISIRATTDEEKDEFYSEAMVALEQCRKKELESVKSSSKDPSPEDKPKENIQSFFQTEPKKRRLDIPEIEVQNQLN